MAPWLQLPFMIITMLIAIPTGDQDLLVDGDALGRLDSSSPPPCLFALGFLITFTLGGITGFFLAAVPADLHEHGTYFVVGAHSLRALRRFGVRNFRRPLLLVAEDDRAHDERAARPVACLDHVRRVQLHVLADALAGAARHAAPRRDVRSAIPVLEHVDLDLRRSSSPPRRS